MSVYKPARSPYYHYDFVFRGKRHHGSTGCTAKADAKLFESDRRREAATGVAQKPSITVDEAGGLWWERVGKFDANASTEEYQLANLVAGLGAATAIGDITFEQLARYVARRRGQRARNRKTLVSNATVNRELQLLRRVVNYADASDYAVPKIAWGKLLLAEPKERVRELSAAEEASLFDRLDADLAAVAEFAMLSGQRRTSVISLLWTKVDLGGMRAEVRIKGGAWHQFPLTPRMVAILANRPKVGPRVFTYVCQRPAPPRGDRPRRVKGRRYPFSKQGWTRRWRRALKDAGIEDFRFHDLRHTTGTRMLRATGNLKAVQRLLAHTDIATTARYAHALEDDVRDAMLAAESRNSPGQAKVTALKTRGKPRR